jgi:hypothetical protein
MRWSFFAAATAAVFQIITALIAVEVSPPIAGALGISILLTIAGLWWTDYEARKEACGAPIPAHRLPLGAYRIVGYVILKNGDILALVSMGDHEIKYCRLSRHEMHGRYCITWEEVKNGMLDYFEVAPNVPYVGGKRILLMRFYRHEIETLGETHITGE